jgi:hypothetical protein
MADICPTNAVLPDLMIVTITDKAPKYAILSSLFLLPPPQVHILPSSAPCSQTLTTIINTSK